MQIKKYKSKHLSYQKKDIVEYDIPNYSFAIILNYNDGCVILLEFKTNGTTIITKELWGTRPNWVVDIYQKV